MTKTYYVDRSRWCQFWFLQSRRINYWDHWFWRPSTSMVVPPKRVWALRWETQLKDFTLELFFYAQNFWWHWSWGQPTWVQDDSFSTCSHWNGHLSRCKNENGGCKSWYSHEFKWRAHRFGLLLVRLLPCKSSPLRQGWCLVYFANFTFDK